VDLVAKELRLLKKDELRGMPDGVGRRDCWLVEAVEAEFGSPPERFLLNVFVVNLLKASETDDFRWPIGRPRGWPESELSSTSSTLEGILSFYALCELVCIIS
jgi:hypothetical protein